MINLQGYRTIIAAVLTCVAAITGQQLEADVMAQALINLIGMGITIYYRLQANKL